MEQQVYVVTNPEMGWDCVVGVFTDKDYVYSKYNNERYCIFDKKVDNTKLKKLSDSDLARHGRTNFKYEIIRHTVKRTGDFESEVKGETIYNIIDPEEGEFIIKFDGKEQGITLDSVSVIADLFCEYTGIDQSSIRIFTDGYTSLYLGSITPYEDDRDLWDSFKKKGVELYY